MSFRPCNLWTDTPNYMRVVRKLPCRLWSSQSPASGTCASGLRPADPVSPRYRPGSYSNRENRWRYGVGSVGNWTGNAADPVVPRSSATSPMIHNEAASC